MSRSLHVRLDDSSAQALKILGSESTTDSEVVREALREAAARALRRNSLKAEAGRIAADEADRREMEAVRDLMADLAPDRLV